MAWGGGLQSDGIPPTPGHFARLFLLLPVPLPLLTIGVVKDMVGFVLLDLGSGLFHGPLELVLVCAACMEEDGRHGVPE